MAIAKLFLYDNFVKYWMTAIQKLNPLGKATDSCRICMAAELTCILFSVCAMVTTQNQQTNIARNPVGIMYCGKKVIV